jgi:hypothetical protein
MISKEKKLEFFRDKIVNKAINWEQNQSPVEAKELCAAVQQYLSVRRSAK